MKILHIDIEGEYIPDHPRYFITKDGAVWSLVFPDRPRLLCQQLSQDGYLRVKLDGQYHGVHRLLGICFHPNPHNLAQIHHIDGDKLNNKLDNLEWVTQQENLRHAMEDGVHNWGITPITGTNRVSGEKLYFESQAEAASAGFCQPNINKCLKGERPAADGYYWEYTT